MSELQKAIKRLSPQDRYKLRQQRPHLFKANPKKRKRKGFVVPKYKEYLRSHKWMRKRKKMLALCGSQCENCGNTKRLQVHHLHYRTLGRESVNDLKLLCDSCHKKEHGIA